MREEPCRNARADRHTWSELAGISCEMEGENMLKKFMRVIRTSSRVFWAVQGRLVVKMVSLNGSHQKTKIK